VDKAVYLLLMMAGNIQSQWNKVSGWILLLVPITFQPASRFYPRSIGVQ